MYKILEAGKLAGNIYKMVVEAPRVAKHCLPGQFVIVKMDEVGERIPLTICDYDQRSRNYYYRIPANRSIYRKDSARFRLVMHLQRLCRPTWTAF